MSGRDDIAKAQGAEGEANFPSAPDPRQVRLLKTVVIVLGVLILLALMALAAGIVLKSQKGAGGGKAGRWAMPLMAQVPPGAQVEKMALDGERLVVHVRHADGGGEILVFDLRKKALMGRIVLEKRRE
jgi:hypothetical protein